MNKKSFSIFKKYLGDFKNFIQANELMSDDISDVFEKFESVINDSNIENLLKKNKLSSDTPFPLPKELQDLQQGFALFSDGACRGNPGPGAFGCFCQNHRGEKIFEACGVDLPTTNNKMELMGIIRALEMLSEYFLEHNLAHDIQVYIYTDSSYVVDGISKWIHNWKKRGWITVKNEQVKNMDLWCHLDELVNNYKNLTFKWVKGHAGHPQNEYCDTLANQALDEAGY